MSIVIPDLHHVRVSAIRPGHIIRVTDDEILSASDVYGRVRAVKHFNRGWDGPWRIRWDAAVVLGPGEASTGILHVRPGGLVTCISQEQWRRLARRLPPR